MFAVISVCSGVGRGGGVVARIYRKEALDTKMSSVAAATTTLGRLKTFLSR